MASGASTTAANAEYDKMHDPGAPLPTPPVQAARLSQLLKALANAESAVSEVIKSRTALIEGLEKFLETNRSALSKEQSMATQLSERKTETEANKRKVEDGIMRGLSVESSQTVQADQEAEPGNVARPEVEALTPPPVEALTPVGSPKQGPQENPSTTQQTQPAGGFTVPGIVQPSIPYQELDVPRLSAYSNEQMHDDPDGVPAKKRKVAHTEEDYAAFASGDLDADVAELLAQEGNPQ